MVPNTRHLKPEIRNLNNQYIVSDLVVIGFDDEHTAFEMRAALANFKK